MSAGPTPARWEALWRALELAPPPDAARAALVARYAEPHRHYHDVRHLAECLVRFDGARARAAHPAEVECALWYHDAVHDPRRDDNEARSAALAVEALARAGAPPRVRARVEALILATRHAAVPSGPDEALVTDVDLGILAADAARFDEYERAVRAEYAWVPEILFRRTRRRILQEFLDRERIYWSGAFDDDEPRARENLRRSIARLGG